MIAKLQRTAQAIQILRLPSIAVGLISLAAIVVIVFASKSHEGDVFLIPSIVSLLWAMNTHAFILTFRSIPEQSTKSLKFFSRLKRNMIRAWYWFIGVVFLCSTVAATFLTYRLVSIWLRDFGV
jgi:hypothetical protein